MIHFARSRMVTAVVLAGCLLAMCSAEPAGYPAKARAAGADRPNVVVVMTDDQDVASLAVMPVVREQLARQGTTFAESFVAYSLCCPSRATFMTGQYPHNHGVLGHTEPDGGYYHLRGEETLPVWLKRAGYSTAHVGKYLNGYGSRDPYEIPAGWDKWFTAVEPTPHRMWNYTVNDNGLLRTFGAWGGGDPKTYQTDVYAAKASEYLRDMVDSPKPFFLALDLLAPHSEVPPPPGGVVSPRPAPRHKGAFADAELPRPPSFDEADIRDKPRHIRSQPRLTREQIRWMTLKYRARLASLLAVDEAVGKLVELLRDRGVLDNTLIIFTSDNGWLQGQHRIMRGKVYPYEASIRVPLIIRGPGVPRNATSTAPASNIDLAPTILAATGARPGITVDGRSLMRPGRLPPTRDLLIETGPKRSGWRWYSAIRTDRYLYVEHSTGERELYDLSVDPDQLRSRHADPSYARIRADLAARLARLRTCAGVTCS